MGKRNKNLPTPYPDLNSVLRDLVESIQAVLSTNFVGAYLQGSFAVGDFDLHSDVDFIVVTEEELSHEQVQGLQSVHERIFRGLPGSKRAGAEWAKANLDPSWKGLIDRAWDGRPNPALSVRRQADPEDFKSTLEFIQYCGNKAHT